MTGPADAAVGLVPHTAASRFSAVFLDFGGVLSPPIDDLFLAYQRRTGIAPADLQAAMAGVADRFGLDALAPVELGLITESEWVRRLYSWLTARGVDVSRSEPEFGRQWFAGHAVNTATRDLALELRRSGYRVGILTNNVREWEQHWRPMVGLDDAVDVIVDSYAVGLRKPDPEIFALAAERIGVPESAAILVDDLPQNCDAARARGWGTVLFADNDGARGDLARLLTNTTEDGPR